ncbi:hypothetical protein [Amycolatopsis sp. lyj-109]|uniref:hypothetical protein n=1 Tax=Amycolatopsis sp. lyj-109 TaxID=2789287 RepID=UPI00397D804A
MLVLLMLVAGGVMLAMGAMNSLLASAQVVNQQAGGVESLAWRLPPGDMVEDTRSILKAWADGDLHDLTSRLMVTYFIADLVYIGLYCLIIWRVWTVVRAKIKQFPPPKPTRLKRLATSERNARVLLLGLLTVFDLAENSLRMVLFHKGPTVAEPWIWVSFGFTSAKWLTVLFIAAVLLDCLRSPQLRNRLWDNTRRLLKVLWRARVATAAVALFTGLVLLEPTGQVNDLLRQWIDAFNVGVFAIAAACALGIGARLSVRELLLEDYAEDDRESGTADSGFRFGFLAASVVLMALAVGFHLHPLWGVVGVLLLIEVLELLWRRMPYGTELAAEKKATEIRQVVAGPPLDRDRQTIHRYSNVLTGAPVIALIYGAINAYTPAAFVLPDDWNSLQVIVFVVGVVLTGTVFTLFGLVISELLPRLTAMLIVVAALPLAVVAACNDQAGVPSLVVLAVMLTLFMAALTVTQRFSERWPVPRGLLVLGFSRVPFALLLVVMLGVCSAIADGSAHDTRRTDDPQSREGIALTDAWHGWLEANCATTDQAAPIPLILVSSQGGGQRAAYWTASSLTQLFGTRLSDAKGKGPKGCPDRTPAEAVFALGGASGGSLGNTAWVSNLNNDNDRPQDWYAKPFALSDPLTRPLSWMLSVDLARAYVGFGGSDRAAIIEEGIERRVEGMGQSYFDDLRRTGSKRPLLMLTGTQVETGCRMNISAVRLTDPDHVGDACNNVERGHPSDAAATNDILDYLCDKDGTTPGGLRRSTAALLSARFPYISPSGRMYNCTNDSATNVVDGGYADNTGVDAMLELWRRLAPMVSDHNRGGGATVVPVFLMLDNHYRALATPRAAGRVQELYIPPSTQGRPDALDDVAAEQRAHAAFSEAIPGEDCPVDLPLDSRFIAIRPSVSPGLQAPLAWSLSQMSIRDLDHQRNTKFAEDPTVAALSKWVQAEH